MTNPKPDVSALAQELAEELRHCVDQFEDGWGWNIAMAKDAIERKFTAALSEQEGETISPDRPATVTRVGEGSGIGRTEPEPPAEPRMACGHLPGDWEPELTVGQGPHCRSCKQQAEAVSQFAQDAAGEIRTNGVYRLPNPAMEVIRLAVSKQQAEAVAQARLDEAKLWKPSDCQRTEHQPLRFPLCANCQAMARWEEHIAELERAVKEYHQ